jgi:hypothetical protein
MFANRMQFFALVFASLGCVAVQAGEPEILPPGMSGVSQTVNDMLRIDAERAQLMEQKMLAEAQGRTGGPALLGGILPGGAQAPVVEQPKPIPAPTPVRLEVLGIFGLGENLLADVAIDNTRVRFKRGQSLPLGAGPDFPYQLISIKIPCVKLADANKTEHNVCLSKSGL